MAGALQTAISTITATAKDIFFNLVTLLLGPPNTVTAITDTSANNFNVAPSGQTPITNFSPYGEGYFSVSNSSTATAAGASWMRYPTGTFNYFGTRTTVEAWIYVPTLIGSTSYPVLTNQDSSGALGQVRLEIFASTATTFTLGIYSTVTNSNAFSTITGNVKEWVHVAWQIDCVVPGPNNQVILSINGRTESVSRNWTGLTAAGSPATALSVGGNGYFSSYLPGFISNLRVVQGDSFVYGPTNFVPPTTPLTAIPGTQVLLCQSNRYVDANTQLPPKTLSNISTSNQIRSSNPFGVNVTSTDGSGFFSSTYANSLSIASSTNFAPTGDFTIRFWFYPTTINATHHLIGNYTANLTTDWVIEITSTGVLQVFLDGATLRLSSSGVVINQWYYVTVTRSGTTVTGRINGANFNVTATYTLSGTFGSATKTIFIGRRGGTLNQFIGYISNVSLVDGTAITDIPTSTLPALTGTNLLTLLYNTPYDNQSFVDSSSNRPLIARNPTSGPNAPNQGTFSPFSVPPNNWSSNWTTTNLSATVAAINPGTVPISLEFWLNWGGLIAGASSGTTVYLWACGSKSSYGSPMQVTIDGTTNIISFVWGQAGNGAPYIQRTAFITPNQWNHWLWIRDGANAFLYKDGVYVGAPGAFAGWSAASTAMQGTQYFNEPATNFFFTGGFQGYLSNFRLITGQAIVSGNFNVSGSGLTTTSIGHTGPNVAPVLTGTVQQLFFNTYRAWNDQSLNGRTPSSDASVQTSPFSPFATSTGWYPQISGGSGYFDGTGDYISATDDGYYDIGSQDFVLEGWAWSNSTTNNRLFCGQWGAAANCSYRLMQNGSRWVFSYSIDGTSVVLLTGTSVQQLNTWNHVAAVRTGNLFALFVNGVREVTGSATGVTMLNSTHPFTIGANALAGDTWVGYVGPCRLVLNNLPPGYNANNTRITVPTAPFENTRSTSILVNFTNAGVYDQSGRNNLETTGTVPVRISTVEKQFGSSTMFFNGNSYLNMLPNKSYTLIGTQDYTLEVWLRPTTVAGSQFILSYGAPVTGATFRILLSGTNPWFLIGSTSIFAPATNSFPAANVWYHFAMVRSGSAANNCAMWVNGTRVSTSFTNTSNFNGGTPLIGQEAGGSFYNGYMRDFRLTLGTARYSPASATITVPVAPLPTS